MKSLKNPMTNAIYIASITAIYAMIFIVSSEFVSKYAYWLSDSRWSLFIQNKNMKFIGLGMIGIAIIIDIFSALRRKKYDEYQIIALEKIMLFNGLFRLNHKFCGISDSSRSSVGSYRIASERNIRHQDIRIPVCEES